MSDIKKIKAEITAIDKEIKKLQANKKKLEKSLISSSDTFEKKFEAWMNSDQGEHYDWLPDESEYPFLRAYIEKKRDLDKYREYDLLEIFDEEISCMLDPKFEETEWMTKEDIQEFKKVAAEMMKKNIVSFTCKW